MLQNIHSQLHKGSNSDSKPAPGFLGTAASHITSGTSKTPILSAVSSAVTHPLTHLPFVAGNSRKFRIPTNEDHERVSALFLGPKAENAPMLRACLDLIVSKQTGTRQSYCPEDQARSIAIHPRPCLTYLNRISSQPTYSRPAHTRKCPRRSTTHSRISSITLESPPSRSILHATAHTCPSTKVSQPSSDTYPRCFTTPTM